MAEKQHIGLPHRAEFGEQVGQRALFEVGVFHVAVFVEGRQAFLLAAGKTQRAVGHDPFGVDEVADHLADGPFVGRVTKTARGFRQAGKAGGQLVWLGFEHGEDVFFGNLGHVGFEVDGVFGGRGALVLAHFFS